MLLTAGGRVRDIRTEVSVPGSRYRSPRAPPALLRRDLDEADLVRCRACALRIVSRPSDTVTVAVPSTHRERVDVPLTVRTPSTASR